MIGTTVAGRYYIHAQIGIGGMGVVYHARDERLRRDVAVKVIAPHLMQQTAARARFLREAQALAGLTHPNIVTVYDLAEDADAGLVLLIMELLSGQSLRQAIEAETCPRSTDCPPFSYVALPLCRALFAAHARGILHRDIKPENIFLCQDGTLKLMDFGLARLLGDVSKNHSSTVAGTLAYMAPEQLRGETPDARADLYALGVVFYEFLTERLPFVADNPGAVLMKHLTEPAPRLQSVRPELPDALDAILARMLEKDPDARFASARDVQAALEQTWPGDGTLALAVDRIQNAHIQNAHIASVINTEPFAPSALNATAGSAVLPTASVQANSVQVALTTGEERLTAHPIADRSNVSARAGRRSPSRTSPLTAGLGAATVVAALLAGNAWSHAPAHGGSPPTPPAAPHSAPATSSLSGSSMTAPALALKTPAGAPRHDTPAASSSDSRANGNKDTTADAGTPNSRTPAATDNATKSDRIANAAPSGNASGGAGSSALAPLSNSERAELETLRREQQEELALLRSLSKKIGDNTARPAQVPMPVFRPVPSVPIGRLAPPTGLVTVIRSAGSGTAIGHPQSTSSTMTTRPTGTPAGSSAFSRPLQGAANGATTTNNPATRVSASGDPTSGAASSTARTQALNETSQYEEALPRTPLILRVSRHAARGEDRAIYISFRNSTDCHAYFYIIDPEKRRAERAYPGPERFLTPQSDAPQELRLPLPADIDNNRRPVLVIAAEQEITGLPPTFNLPPAPLNMPAPGAGVPQMRQAIHRYNDQIGMLLQQSHVQVSGKPLHPHDVLIRITGLRPPPNAH